MGQYFTGTVTKTTKNGTTTVCYDNTSGGAKLTEHSWIGNNYVDGIAKKIYNKKARLVWAGDYAEDEIVSADGTKCTFTARQLYAGGEKYEDGYRTNKWHLRKLDGLKTSTIKNTENNFSYNDKYFVNYSRKEYINLNEYIKRSKMTDDWDGWCQNPISLMVAVGNGLGGGDYDTNAICSDFVGRWAFDLVSIVDKEPTKNFTKLNVTFNENVV